MYLISKVTLLTCVRSEFLILQFSSLHFKTRDLLSLCDNSSSCFLHYHPTTVVSLLYHATCRTSGEFGLWEIFLKVSSQAYFYKCLD